MRRSTIKRMLSALLAVILCAALISAAAAEDSSVPAAPGGSMPSGAAPGGSMPGGTAPGGSMPGGTAPGGTGGGGADTMTYDYTGTLSGALTADGEDKTSENETYSAASADQNAALVENGGTLTIKNGTLTKSGDDTNGDNCNFYGINSILLAVGDGAKAFISNSKLSATSEGSNGIFATDGAAVYVKDASINTTAGNSRGFDATYGGTIVGSNMNITTAGDHCASLATDRGGGYISLTDSSLSTAGSGSPLLYSTGDIEVDRVSGTASGSQIAGMEGLNTILIYNSTLASTITSATASDPIADGVIIYQSTSGDAQATTGSAATFEAVNSTLKSAITSGAMFYLTNTSANLVLKSTSLDFDSDNVNLMTIEGNDSNNWGTAGSNGAAVTLTGIGETLKGNISVDTISSLKLYLTQGTVYTGSTAVTTNSVNTSATDAPITVDLDSDSKWVVTGSSTVSALNAAAGSSIVDADGKTVTITANGQTVVKGDSAYTITVTGAYTASSSGEAHALSTDFIDRTAFDSYYSCSTDFAANAASSSSDPTADSAGDDDQVTLTLVTGTTSSQDMSAASIVVWILIFVFLAAAIIILTVVTRKKKREHAALSGAPDNKDGNAGSAGQKDVPDNDGSGKKD